jgi:hypothetical protein
VRRAAIRSQTVKVDDALGQVLPALADVAAAGERQ